MVKAIGGQRDTRRYTVLEARAHGINMHRHLPM